MQIQVLGHASLRIETESGGRRSALLIDPWFSPTGAFFGSWHQYPENFALSLGALSGVSRILVSHNHADHFDVDFLKHALGSDRQRRLEIAKFSTSWFLDRARRILEPAGDRIVDHEPWQEFSPIDGLTAFFVPEESPSQVDSAIVLHDGRSSLINLNDARLTTNQLRRIRDRIPRPITMALQASGASEYPINYTYDADSMRRRCLEKRQLKFDHARMIIEDIEPDRVLFFAGPPAFLEDGLRKFNDGGPESVFPDQLDVLRHFDVAAPKVTQRAYFVMPGDVLDDTRLWKNADLGDPRFSPYTRKAEYIAEYARRRASFACYDHGEPPAKADLEAHFKKMASISPYMSKMIDGEITFRVRGKTKETVFTVDFRHQRVREGASDAAIYVLTAPAASVAAVLRDEATWDDVFLSARMVFDERTDRFVAHYKTLLKWMDHDLLEKVGEYERSMTSAATPVPMMDVTSGGRRYRVQRLCPHAGADLEVHGKVDDSGTLTCMAHRFTFELEGGRCINAAGYCLRTEKRAP